MSVLLSFRMVSCRSSSSEVNVASMSLVSRDISWMSDSVKLTSRLPWCCCTCSNEGGASVPPRVSDMRSVLFFDPSVMLMDMRCFKAIRQSSISWMQYLFTEDMCS
jgi:hypothetical protein